MRSKKKSALECLIVGIALVFGSSSAWSQDSANEDVLLPGDQRTLDGFEDVISVMAAKYGFTQEEIELLQSHGDYLESALRVVRLNEKAEEISDEMQARKDSIIADQDGLNQGLQELLNICEEKLTVASDFASGVVRKNELEVNLLEMPSCEEELQLMTANRNELVQMIKDLKLNPSEVEGTPGN